MRVRSFPVRNQNAKARTIFCIREPFTFTGLAPNTKAPSAAPIAALCLVNHLPSAIGEFDAE
jgi:hypothetical protein